MGWALAGMILVIIALSIVVGKILWRELRILAIPDQEIQLMAADLVKRHNGAAVDVALRHELDAWHNSDYAMQAKWHRVGKALRKALNRGLAEGVN